MLFIKWLIKLLFDIIHMSVVNRSFAVSLAILALLVLGLVIFAAQISAPFIYTLF